MKTLRAHLFIGGLLLILLPALLLTGYYFREVSRTGTIPLTIDLEPAVAGAAGIVLLALLLIKLNEPKGFCLQRAANGMFNPAKHGGFLRNSQRVPVGKCHLQNFLVHIRQVSPMALGLRKLLPGVGKTLLYCRQKIAVIGISDWPLRPQCYCLQINLFVVAYCVGA